MLAGRLDDELGFAQAYLRRTRPPVGGHWLLTYNDGIVAPSSTDQNHAGPETSHLHRILEHPQNQPGNVSSHTAQPFTIRSSAVLRQAAAWNDYISIGPGGTRRVSQVRVQVSATSGRSYKTDLAAARR